MKPNPKLNLYSVAVFEKDFTKTFIKVIIAHSPRVSKGASLMELVIRAD